MRINHNISSLTTQSSLFKVNRDIGKNLEKLSTGLRINRAADDAAGLAVSENLRTQVKGISQALKNTQDAISMLTIADGALQEQTDILQRMRELCIQAKNDTYTQTERDYMGKEYEALLFELDRIANSTNFNGMKLFATRTERFSSNNPNADVKHVRDGGISFSEEAIFGELDNGAIKYYNMLIGPNYSNQDSAEFSSSLNSFSKDSANFITLQIGQMDSAALFRTNASTSSNSARNDLGPTSSNVFYTHNAIGPVANRFGPTINNKLGTLIQLIDGDKTTFGSSTFIGNGNNLTGLKRINTMRAYIGATINRLEHNINNLLNGEANQQAAESQIRDADLAEETAKFTKNQILTQSSTAMLVQANMLPQGVLGLIR